ncbi:MAG: discoidin domain-containing protein [Lachnospiraceae bacterium]
MDARITSGWFWGNNILERVAEFGNNIKESFAVNLAADARVSASEVRGNDVRYKPSNVLDGMDDTYWTADDGTTTAQLLIDLGGEKKVDVVSIEEAIQFGQRIKNYRIEYRSGDSEEWKIFDEGTTIGSKRLSRKGTVKADELRITVSTSAAVPMISEIGVYKASKGFELVNTAPEGMDVIDIKDSGFSSETLEDGPHTLRLDTKNKAIGIEGAYVINNGGIGMIGIENAEYTMNEDSELEVTLVRVGGDQAVTVTLSPNPGSAIQDDYDTECISTVTFEEGETEKTALVRTKRNTNVTGNQYFTIELSCEDEDVILDFHDSAKIIILDADEVIPEEAVVYFPAKNGETITMEAEAIPTV